MERVCVAEESAPINTNRNVHYHICMPKHERLSTRILSFNLILAEIFCIFLVIALSETSNLGHLLTRANAQLSFPSPADDNFLTYENSTNGIRINYPSSWEVRTDLSFLTSPASQLGVSVPTNENVTLVAAFLPLLIPDALVFIVMGEDVNQTLDEVAKEAIGVFRNVTSTANQSGSEFQFSNVRFEGPNRTTLAGNPAYQVVQTASVTVRQGTIFEETTVFETKALYVFTVKNHNLYAMAYEGVGDGYNNHLATAQKMIDSFEIMDVRNNATNVT
jgi:hypothetical protein